MHAGAAAGVTATATVAQPYSELQVKSRAAGAFRTVGGIRPDKQDRCQWPSGPVPGSGAPPGGGSESDRDWADSRPAESAAARRRLLLVAPCSGVCRSGAALHGTPRPRPTEPPMQLGLRVATPRGEPAPSQGTGIRARRWPRPVARPSRIRARWRGVDSDPSVVTVTMIVPGSSTATSTLRDGGVLLTDRRCR